MTARVLDQPRALPAVADPERLAAVEQTGLLDGQSDPTLDRLARLAAALVGAPVSFVSLVGLDRQVMPGAARLDGGDPLRSLTIDDSFCQYPVATGEPLVVRDARTDPLVQWNGAVQRSEVLAYAGIPLTTELGHVLGTLCVLDQRPRQFDERQLGLLRDLAALVELELEHRLAGGRILGLQGLGRQVADRVATLGDSLAGLVELAERQDDPRLQRYAAVTRSRFGQLEEWARDLREASTRTPEAASAPMTTTVDLRHVVQRAVDAVRAVTKTDSLKTAITPVPLRVECDPLQLERSISHVLVTALHHAAPGSLVDVRLAHTGASTDAGGGTSQPLGAELAVVAPSSRVPAAELGRVVARFQAAKCDEAGADSGERPGAVRVTGGAVIAQSGRARGRSSREGTDFRARWSLGRSAVIDLRSS